MYWITYLPEDIRAEFPEERGIKLNFEEYDSIETMMAELKAGVRYDLAFPGGDFVPAMIYEGMLQLIDHSLIPNLSSIDPVVIKLSYINKLIFSEIHDFRLFLHFRNSFEIILFVMDNCRIDWDFAETDRKIFRIEQNLP